MRRLDRMLRKARAFVRRHGIPPASELTDREKAILKAIREEPEARQAFGFLSRKTRVGVFLVAHFVQEAFGPAAVRKHSARAELEEAKKLERYANTLRRTAGRIRELNAHRHWHMTVAVLAEIPRRRRAQLSAAFEDLPIVLELYAANVRRKALVGHRWARMEPSQAKLQREWTDQLLNFIEDRCGKPYRDRVVAILRVTHPLANRQPPASGETFRKRLQRRQARSRQ